MVCGEQDRGRFDKLQSNLDGVSRPQGDNPRSQRGFSSISRPRQFISRLKKLACSGGAFLMLGANCYGAPIRALLNPQGMFLRLPLSCRLVVDMRGIINPRQSRLLKMDMKCRISPI